MLHQTDYKRTSAGIQKEWPEPEPGLFEDGRPVLPAFPLDVLPQPWREWVSDAAGGAGAPVDYVAQALLAAVAGLGGAGVRACVTPSWSEPLVLWQALVGGSSAGKTPALETIGLPLASVEKLLSRDAGEKGQSARLVVHDAAPAALARAVSARPPGVLLWRDESVPWLRSLVGESPLIDAWSARGKLAVSIIGSLHPEALAAALEGATDGLAARFLFAWPGPPASRSLVDVPAPREDEAVTALHRLAGLVGSPEQPLRLAFEEEAVMFFDRFLANVAEEMRGAEGVEAAWLGKGRGTVARLAAVLALLDWSRHAAQTALPRAVTRDHLQAAGRLWRDYFQPHARAVLARAAPSDFEQQARRVARWLKAGVAKRTEVTRTEVRVQALGKTVNAGRTEAVLGRLWAAGIVRPSNPEPRLHAGRPPQRWEINPALATA